MSSRSARIIVICEDTQHAVFVRRFLILSKLKGHAIRVRKCPPGGQDAKQWIRQVLPGELKAFRNYNAKNPPGRRVLCIMADADNLTVNERIDGLSAGCDPKPDPSENVCFIIPRWAVETWIKYLRPEEFDESARIQRREKYRDARDCWAQVDVLKTMCDSGSLRSPAPPSLDDACQQFQRVRSVLQS